MMNVFPQKHTWEGLGVFLNVAITLPDPIAVEVLTIITAARPGRGDALKRYWDWLGIRGYHHINRDCAAND